MGPRGQSLSQPLARRQCNGRRSGKHPGSVLSCSAAGSTVLTTSGDRAIGDYELHKQLYKGKASVLYSATCKQSGIHVALKLYRKPRLSDLNWYQAGPSSSA